MALNKIRKDIHNSNIPAVCRACEARHGGVCGALEPEQLSELSKYTTRTAHSRDLSLTKINEEPDSYSNILSGVVKLIKNMSDGRQQIVGLQFAPDFLGRPFGNNSSVVAQAATDVRLCTFPKSAFEKIVSQSPEMELRLHQQHMRELDEARDWMLTLGRKNAIEKVASFILLLVSHIDPEHESDISEVEITMPLKRSDIADFLGLTIETVSRQITHLRKQGVVSVTDRKSILVVDFDKLKQIAN